MKTLDSKKVIETIKKHEEKYKSVLHNYGYFNEIDIDKTIFAAETIKELKLITEDIKSLDMSMADLEPVYNAVGDLAGHKVLKGTKKYDAALKIIADFLDINLDDFKNEEDEDESEN